MKMNKFLIALFVLAVLFVLSLFIGPTSLNGFDIIFHIRLPRVLQAVIAGCALSVAGVIFQGVLKNPLCDPYILGTSSGALFGAVLAQVIGLNQGSFFFYILIGASALGATLIAYNLAKYKKQVSNVDLILAGVIISTFLSALVLLFLSLHRESALNIVFFMMGGLYETDKGLLIAAAVLVFIGIMLALSLSRQLDIFSLGEEKAVHLGINTEKYKIIYFTIASLITACAVSISGTIGFVGLVVPHMARLIVGPSHFRLILASAIGGSMFLIVTDAFARTVIAPGEIPVGIITALVGAPFFLWLLFRNRGKIK
ncbi:MAG: iron ABC transporter permease [Elusimicrobiales bacterium]|nr:iron ABC transporter permease [Elusimicrobiales bacterium]MCK5105972.1 iron ABC transporter permease [Elusimicrobiales bacterium]MCK5582672.1 iron ABC transporter permease [Elusimicrobiales bacterium]